MSLLYRLNHWLGWSFLPIARIKTGEQETATLRNDGWVIIRSGKSSDALPIVFIAEATAKRLIDQVQRKSPLQLQQEAEALRDRWRDRHDDLFERHQVVLGLLRGAEQSISAQHMIGRPDQLLAEIRAVLVKEPYL